MNASRTARDRVRAELIREITEAARRHLATEGAAGLSLRAVAREMGMVSSAIYRYFPSRDDLLTRLIIDGYNALGEAVEKAGMAIPRDDYAGRWLAACRAVRHWALAHPHEYALIYGSPVPGYRAPEQTIGPAARAAAVFGAIIGDAYRAGARAEAGPVPAGPAEGGPVEAGPVEGGPVEAGPVEAGPVEAGPVEAGPVEAGPVEGGPVEAGPTETGPVEAGRVEAGPVPAVQVPRSFAGDAARLRDTVLAGVPDGVAARALVAWSGLFGLVSFELSGQFENVVTNRAAFFDYAIACLGRLTGVPV